MSYLRARLRPKRIGARSGSLTAAEARSHFAARIRDLVEKLGIVHEPAGTVDERWYWLAPMLLDFARISSDDAQAWWERAELAQTWAGVEVGEEDAGWSRHVEQAMQTLRSVRSRQGTSRLAAGRSF